MKKLLLILILGISFNLPLSMVNSAYADHHEKDLPNMHDNQSCDDKKCADQSKCACKMAKKSHSWHHKKMDHTQFYLNHAKEINLSDAQVKQLEEMHVKFEEKNQSLHQQWREKQSTFSETVHDKKTTEKNIKQHAQEMGKLKATMIEHHLLHQHASAKVLNDQQNQKVWDLLKEKKESHKEKKYHKNKKKNKRNPSKK